MFELKKITLKKYIEEIWGWDEAYQHLLLKEEVQKEMSYIITSAQRKIGVLTLSQWTDYVFVENLLILPEYQGHGVGSSILKTLIAQNKDKGKKTRLGAFKNNVAANRLYIRLGFERVEETDTHFIYEI